jgi:hypothetical protein
VKQCLPYITRLLSMKVSGLLYSLSNVQTFFYENWSSIPHLSWSSHVRLIGPWDQQLIHWSYVTITFIALLGIDHDTQDGWNGAGQKWTWKTEHLAAILETSRPWGDSHPRHPFFHLLCKICSRETIPPPLVRGRLHTLDWDNDGRSHTAIRPSLTTIRGWGGRGGGGAHTHPPPPLPILRLPDLHIPHNQGGISFCVWKEMGVPPRAKRRVAFICFSSCIPLLEAW